jgi:hypothetical protein
MPISPGQIWTTFTGHFDLLTAIETIFIVPIITALGIVVKRLVVKSTHYVGDFLVFFASRFFLVRLSAALTLTRYARLNLSGSTATLNVPNPVADIPLNIDDVFVPLSLETAMDEKLYDHETLLTTARRVRIIGDPGSGKSTIAKRLFRDECRKALERKLCRLPVLIELKTISLPSAAKPEALGKRLLEAVKTAVLSHNVYEMNQCFSTYISTRGLLLILDGLDEVSSNHYFQLRDGINALSLTLQANSENNIVVLTMRAQFHQHVRRDYTETFPTVFTLRRFSPTDIYIFLSRWPFPTAQKQNDMSRIYNELSDRPALREMCTNPLILSMYVAMDQHAAKKGLTPETRARFYESVTEELIIRRRASQLGKIENLKVIRTQRYRTLGAIAFVHLVKGTDSPNYIDWNQAVSTAMIASGRTSERARIETELLLRELEKDTGLITEERNEEILRFIHLTFCEFLAAYYAKEFLREGWHEIADIAFRNKNDPRLSTRLAEVLPFCAALLPESAQADALLDIFNLDNNYVLALCYLETKAYSGQFNEFRQRFERSLIETAGHPSSTDWFRDVHIYLTVMNDAQRVNKALSGEHTERYDVVGFFQRITCDSNISIARLAISYAEQDANAAFRVATDCGVDIAREAPELITRNLDQPPFLEMMLKYAIGEYAHKTQLLCLIAEAGLASIAVAEAIFMRQPLPIPTENTAMKGGWYTSGLIEDTLLAQCLDHGKKYYSDTTSTAIPLLMRFNSIAPPYTSRFERMILFMSQNLFTAITISYFVSVFASAFVLGVIMGRLDADRRIVVFGFEAQSDAFVVVWIMFTVLLCMIVICFLPFVHRKYIVTAYYKCLNLSSMMDIRTGSSTRFMALTKPFRILTEPSQKTPRPLTKLFARTFDPIDAYLRFRANSENSEK